MYKTVSSCHGFGIEQKIFFCNSNFFFQPQITELFELATGGADKVYIPALRLHTSLLSFIPFLTNGPTSGKWKCVCNPVNLLLIQYNIIIFLRLT